MAHSIYDFVKGLDFTALLTATAGDHNSLVDLATPNTDKGLVLWSRDTALDTPDVPNANSTTKWKRYLWIRVPHTSSPTTIPLFYAWNDSATSVATYLQWQRIEVDLTAINTRVDDVEADLLVVETTANNAATTANSASLTASNALSVATSAQTTANTAASDAATALAAVNTPVTGAAAVASTAQTTATNANNTATSAAANLAILQALFNTFTTDKGLTTSSEFPLVVGSTYSITHGYGATPKTTRWVMRCVAAEHGYSIGDEIEIASVTGTAGSNYNCFSAYANTTAIKLYHGALFTPIVLRLSDGTAQLVTLGSWVVKCYYSKG